MMTRAADLSPETRRGPRARPAAGGPPGRGPGGPPAARRAAAPRHGESARDRVIEAAARLLPAAEPEAGDLLASVFAREGIEVRTGTRAGQVSHNGNQFTVDLGKGTGDADGTITARQLLVATGRRTGLGALGVAAAGLDANARTLHVDERMRAAEGVWAIAAITALSAHTHMAMYQAGIAVRDILGAAGPAADYRALPAVTFTDPEIGSVGLTEAQARARGLHIRTGITQHPSSARGWVHHAE